jgi:hypothetical protein
MAEHGYLLEAILSGIGEKEKGIRDKGRCKALPKCVAPEAVGARPV